MNFFCNKSWGGEVEEFGGEASPAPPPLDETLEVYEVNSYVVGRQDGLNSTLVATIMTQLSLTKVIYQGKKSTLARAQLLQHFSDRLTSKNNINHSLRFIHSLLYIEH